jgi:NADH:ubiquinone oxidoreductase subunit 2 (subunit N)
LAIAGLPPLAGFCAKGLLSAATDSLPLYLLLVLLSLGTVVSFSKLTPLLNLRRGCSDERAKAISYSILVLPIVAFLLLLFPFVSRIQILSSLSLLQAGESLAIIGAGFLVYLVLRGHPVHLSQRIFRLEEAILTILSMFFVVFLLLAVL